MTGNGPDHVFDQVRGHTSTWEPDRLRAAGFGPVFGGDDRARRERREQARTVLLSEELLEGLVEDYGHPMVLVKGLEAAMLYPNPTMRHFRDVDVVAGSPLELFRLVRSRGFSQKPNRRSDIDHHHLPPLIEPGGRLAVEVHHRVNTPAWAQIESDVLFSAALASRTGIPGLTRPRDDHHALIMALHYWKSGLTRQRDLLDALLFAAAADRSVEDTAAELGLARVWNITVQLAEYQLLGEPNRIASILSSGPLARKSRITGHSRARLVIPYLAANPMRVTKGHWTEFQLGRAARRLDNIIQLE